MFSLALRHPGLPLAEGTSSKEVEINVTKGDAARPEMEGQPTLGACLQLPSLRVPPFACFYP